MITVGLTQTIDVLHITRDQLAEDVAGIMDHLLTLEQTGCGIADTAVSADLGANTVTIELLATGENYLEAEQLALSCMRAAIHEVGGSTPGWEISSTNSSTEIVPVLV